MEAIIYKIMRSLVGVLILGLVFWGCTYLLGLLTMVPGLITTFIGIIVGCLLLLVLVLFLIKIWDIDLFKKLEQDVEQKIKKEG